MVNPPFKNAEVRQIKVAVSFAYHLITAQSGTLSKAVLENVMNSHDAGASEVRIDIDAKGVVITDNGRGFANRDEILAVFEELGFEHPEAKDEHRTFGKFGIGRAQMWSFASTVWRSNALQMDVDIRAKGLDYLLYDDLPQQPGCTITGTFYKRLVTSDMITFEREITELALYAPLAVYLNGKLISKDPTAEKWPHETKDAWIRLKDGGELTVYNNGVMVRTYPAEHLGSGGIVITKPDVRLALNTARNDVLTSQCKVWPRIKGYIQRQSDTRVRTKSTRITDGELANLARRFVGKELSLAEIEKAKLITDIAGRGYTIEMFVRHATSYRADGVITVAEKGSRKGERAHQGKMAFVLSPITLDRFHVQSPTELQALLKKRIKFDNTRYWTRWLDDLRYVNDFAQAVPDMADDYEVLPLEEHTKEENVALAALSSVANRLLSRGLMDDGSLDYSNGHRTLHIGVSQSALAWTDGARRVVLSRPLMAQATRGLAGIIVIVNVLLHEYLHDAADTGSHEHDLDFMTKYHDLTSDPDSFVAVACSKTFAAYVEALKQEGVKLRAAVIRDADTADAAHDLDGTPEAPRVELRAVA